MRTMLATLAIYFCFASVTSAAPPASAASPSTEPGHELVFYLMTMSPGSEIYERFGHNAIIVRDTVSGSATAYNWGMFSFEQSNFVWRFIHGRLEYWMEGLDANQMIVYYKQDNRSIWLDELNLTPAQRVKLRDFLNWNAKLENRDYRYDYYRDNCSTRVRDAIDLALGGQLKNQLAPRPAGTTYRWHTRRLTADNLFWFTALTSVLGHAVDVPLSEWEDSFLPMNLRNYLLKSSVAGSSGSAEPLVRRSIDVATAARPPERAAPPNWTMPFAAVGCLLGAFILFTARLSLRHRWASVALALAACAWAIVAGAGGAIASYGWLVTDHTASWRNENLLQLPPISLLLIPLAPLAIWGGRKNLRAARWLAMVIAAMSCLGFLLQALPGMYQVNGEIIGLALPINLAVALAFFVRSQRRVGASAEPPAA